MSLYERIAERPCGERDLAAARLRYEVLALLHKAMEASGKTEHDLAAELGISVRVVRKILDGSGDVLTSTLAEYLHALGFEAEISLVPAGEPRRKALAGAS